MDVKGDLKTLKLHSLQPQNLAFRCIIFRCRRSVTTGSVSVTVTMLWARCGAWKQWRVIILNQIGAFKLDVELDSVATKQS